MATAEEYEFSGGAVTALLGGSAPWSAQSPKPESVTELVSAIEILALVSSLGIVWYSIVRSGGEFPFSPVVVCSLGFAVLLVDPILRTFRKRPVSRSLRLNLILRGTATAAIGVSELVILSGWSALLVIPFAIAAGADTSLTARELGWLLHPMRWWRRFLGSPFHLGVIGAVAATYVYNQGDRYDPWPAFVATHLSVVTTLTVAWVVGIGLERVDSELADERRIIVEDERRRRAHWLHDDVCAEIRLISLRVQTQDMAAGEIVALLDNLDHQFRLRQLDELLDSGPIQVAELLQPYIRRAQNVGVAIDQVPSFDEASFTLSGNQARLFARAAALFTSNALNVSARHLTYLVERSATVVRLTVSDDGPGFELDDVSHGRGLWSLRHELRPGHLEITTSPLGGAAVTAVILLGEGERRV